MKYIVSIAFSLILFLSCTNNNKSDKQNNVSDLLILDLDKAPVEDSLYVSTFTTSVTPIVLETTDDNLIGFASCMQVTEERICILDDGPGGSGSLFVFDKSGRFQRKIGRKGQGPGEYLSIRDFTIDEEKDEIFLNDDESDRIWIYKLSTGGFLRELDFKDERVVYHHIQSNGDKLLTDMTYYSSKVKEGPMVYTLNAMTGDIESKHLDIGVHNNGWLRSFFKGESFFYCKNSDKPKYTHYFMDTVMAVTNGGLEPYLAIRSKDWVTADFFKGKEFSPMDISDDPYFQIQNEPIAYGIQNYVESDRYIHFAYNKQKQYITVVYDKKKDILKQTIHLLDDIMFAGRKGWVTPIVCGDENGMYQCINTPVVDLFYKNVVADPASGMKPEYRKIVEEKVVEDSNPVILYYEYKK